MLITSYEILYLLEISYGNLLCMFLCNIFVLFNERFTCVKNAFPLLANVFSALVNTSSKAGFTLRRLDRRLDKPPARPVKVAQRL